MFKIKLFGQVFIACLILLGIGGAMASGTKTGHDQTTNHYKVRIVLDTSFKSNMIGMPDLWPGRNASMHYEFDSSSYTITIVWDSIPAGSCTFTLTNVFDLQQTFTFMLSSDTTIIVSNRLDISAVPVIEENELENTDTIQVMYSSSGCFHGYTETAKITRNKNGTYHLHANGRNEKHRPAEWDKTVSAKVIKNIYRLEKSAIATGKRTAGSRLFSTTTQGLYIMANKHLFRYTDSTGQWKSYGNFKKQYCR